MKPVLDRWHPGKQLDSTEAGSMKAIDHDSLSTLKKTFETIFMIYLLSPNKLNKEDNELIKHEYILIYTLLITQ